MDEQKPESTEPTQPGERTEVPTEAPKEEEAPRISIDDFFKTELRVARVVHAERVPKADRLLRLEIDLGTEQRQLVAGVAATYEPEALIGKRIVVVANLKPARIRGVESQGMLLAADLDGRPVVATFDEPVPPGTLVR